MNPQDELQSLTTLFSSEGELIEEAKHVSASQTPEPYKQLLAHDHHMTLSMEQHHQCTVDVKVLDEHLEENRYTRKILLLNKNNNKAVQFGIVRFNFDYVTSAVREEILSGTIPLGRVLINHNVLRNVDLGAMLAITAGAELAGYFDQPSGVITYGRLATIFCNQQPAVDLLEVSAPLNESVH
ncbi:hypothetical protein MNBD_PLANCTO02-444 [hydrothermal vent metagenome]|uniref:Uncharacterized protein n=1 Tax=hydrothermal vent metagenome TaxID=652676 RepID=A0A3B1D8Z5_9ZZZZ